jgi:uncharacterized membrane protein YdjX (TVP38/TMEM64 family)
MKKRIVIKGGLFGIFLLSVVLMLKYTNIKNYAEPEYLHTWISEFGPWGPIVYISIYSIAPTLLFPGTPLTIAGGILFGPIAGTIYATIGATIGASFAFLIARYMARELVTKLFKHGKLSTLDKEVEKQGWKIVAFTRLIPIFPFNFLNYAFGLTSIKFSHYVLASFIFMLPAIVAFVLFSSSLLDLFKGKVSREFLIGIILVIVISVIPILYMRIKGKHITNV